MADYIMCLLALFTDFIALIGSFLVLGVVTNPKSKLSNPFTLGRLKFIS